MYVPSNLSNTSLPSTQLQFTNQLHSNSNTNYQLTNLHLNENKIFMGFSSEDEILAMLIQEGICNELGHLKPGYFSDGCVNSMRQQLLINEKNPHLTSHKLTQFFNKICVLFKNHPVNFLSHFSSFIYFTPKINELSKISFLNYLDNIKKEKHESHAEVDCLILTSWSLKQKEEWLTFLAKISNCHKETLRFHLFSKNIFEFKDHNKIYRCHFVDTCDQSNLSSHSLSKSSVSNYLLSQEDLAQILINFVCKISQPSVFNSAEFNWIDAMWNKNFLFIGDQEEKCVQAFLSSLTHIPPSDPKYSHIPSHISYIAGLIIHHLKNSESKIGICLNFNDVISFVWRCSHSLFTYGHFTNVDILTIWNLVVQQFNYLNNDTTSLLHQIDQMMRAEIPFSIIESVLTLLYWLTDPLKFSFRQNKPIVNATTSEFTLRFNANLEKSIIYLNHYFSHYTITSELENIFKFFNFSKINLLASVKVCETLNINRTWLQEQLNFFVTHSNHYISMFGLKLKDFFFSRKDFLQISTLIPQWITEQKKEHLCTLYSKVLTQYPHLKNFKFDVKDIYHLSRWIEIFLDSGDIELVKIALTIYKRHLASFDALQREKVCHKIYLIDKKEGLNLLYQSFKDVDSIPQTLSTFVFGIIQNLEHLDDQIDWSKLYPIFAKLFTNSELDLNNLKASSFVNFLEKIHDLEKSTYLMLCAITLKNFNLAENLIDRLKQLFTRSMSLIAAVQARKSELRYQDSSNKILSQFVKLFRPNSSVLSFEKKIFWVELLSSIYIEDDTLSQFPYTYIIEIFFNFLSNKISNDVPNLQTKMAIIFKLLTHLEKYQLDPQITQSLRTLEEFALKPDEIISSSSLDNYVEVLEKINNEEIITFLLFHVNFFNGHPLTHHQIVKLQKISPYFNFLKKITNENLSTEQLLILKNLFKPYQSTLPYPIKVKWLVMLSEIYSENPKLSRSEIYSTIEEISLYTSHDTCEFKWLEKAHDSLFEKKFLNANFYQADYVEFRRHAIKFMHHSAYPLSLVGTCLALKFCAKNNLSFILNELPKLLRDPKKNQHVLDLLRFEISKKYNISITFANHTLLNWIDFLYVSRDEILCKFANEWRFSYGISDAGKKDSLSKLNVIGKETKNNHFFDKNLFELFQDLLRPERDLEKLEFLNKKQQTLNAAMVLNHYIASQIKKIWIFTKNNDYQTQSLEFFKNCLSYFLNNMHLPQDGKIFEEFFGKFYEDIMFSINETKQFDLANLFFEVSHQFFALKNEVIPSNLMLDRMINLSKIIHSSSKSNFNLNEIFYDQWWNNSFLLSALGNYLLDINAENRNLLGVALVNSYKRNKNSIPEREKKVLKSLKQSFLY